MCRAVAIGTAKLAFLLFSPTFGFLEKKKREGRVHDATHDPSIPSSSFPTCCGETGDRRPDHLIAVEMPKEEMGRLG